MADLSDLAWDEFGLGVGPDDRVSANFRCYELTRSQVAARQGIDNGFESAEALQCAVYLCREVLQPVRDAFGPFSPNSVYRCQDLERALKNKRRPWTSTSQHTRGQACDIEIPGIPTLDLARWVADRLEFDQLICECYDPTRGPNAGWVHVSLLPPGRGTNRKNLLSYVMDPAAGRYVFVDGLHASTVV